MDDAVEVVKSRYDAIKSSDEDLFFVIAKSSNKNTLAYSFDSNVLLNPYWLMYEKSTSEETPTESLTFLERKLAYGISTKQCGPSHHEITLVGYKSLIFRLHIDEDDESTPKKKLTLNLDDDHVHVTGIYVHESVGIFTSGVDGISIVYTDKEETLQVKYIANK